MQLAPERIGPYPIERELGRGGMGIVYLGRDPALGRPVAVKVLPREVAGDPERLARFDREARLLAAVHHPNVASIFNVGADGDGRRYLALEFVPGETLAKRLARGALPLAEALDVCRQIAAGLEAAHEAGVVHRDLKPANVRLTPDGVAKVLDFGLAKGTPSSGDGEPSQSFAESPTATFQTTEAGRLLGTVTYMSPEQARGKPVDRRTDVWALGCILYECLTGRAPFAGETTSDVLARILEREPSWEALPASTPPRVRELLHRSLEKDKSRRLRDVGDARLELETAESERGSATAVTVTALPAPRRRWPKAAAAALALALLTGAAGWWLGRRGEPANSAPRFSIVLPAELQVSYGAPLPYCNGLVVVARRRGEDALHERLYWRPLDSFELVPIPGTEGANNIYFTPDNQVRFTASPAGAENELWQYIVPPDGSAPPTALWRWDPDWGSGGSVLTLPDGSDLVNVQRGTAFVRIPRGERKAGKPMPFDVGVSGTFSFTDVILDEGRWVMVLAGQSSDAGWIEGTAVVDTATGKGHLVLERGSAQALTADGTLLFSRGSTLLAAPFDRRSRRISGPEVSLLGGLRVFGTGRGGFFDLTPDGSLVFVPGGDLAAERQLVACAPGGRCDAWSPARRRFWEYGDLSARGGRVAAMLVGPRDRFELWELEARGTAAPLVVLPGRDVGGPRWSPDGRRLAYFLEENTPRDEDSGTYVTALDGRPPRRVVSDLSYRDWPVGWIAGTELLVIHRRPREGDQPDIAIADLAGDGRARPLLASPAEERPLDTSPRSRHIAYVSDATGQNQIVLAELRDDGTLGPPVQLSRGRGTRGKFSPAGDAFYFFDDGNTILRASLGSDGLPTEDPPAAVVDLEAEHLFPYFTVLADGRLLFVRKAPGEASVNRFDVIPHFADEVRRRMRERPR